MAKNNGGVLFFVLSIRILFDELISLFTTAGHGNSDNTTDQITHFQIYKLNYKIQWNNWHIIILVDLQEIKNLYIQQRKTILK